MPAPSITFSLRMISLLVLTLTFLLSGCGGGSGKGSGASARSASDFIEIQGRISLNNAAGEPYSYAGAKATIYGIDEAFLLVGKELTELSTAKVRSDGSVTLLVDRTDISDRRLYSIEFDCSFAPASNACNVATPTHIVLEGARLKRGEWNASVLTEMVYQRIAYYIRAEYSPASMNLTLDNIARWLLSDNKDHPARYDDLLRWNPSAPEAEQKLQRPEAMHDVSMKLAQGASNNELKEMAQRLVGPLVGAIRFGDIVDTVITTNFAYVLSGFSGLGIFDIQDPTRPVPLGSLDTPDIARAMAKRNQYIIIAHDPVSLLIVDVSDPSQPSIVSKLQLPNDAAVRDIAINGDFLYVAAGTRGVIVVSIFDPRRPVLVSIKETGDSTTKIAVSGQLAFVSTINGELRIFDVSIPHILTPLATVEMEGTVCGMSISGNYLFVGDLSGLSILNIENPLNPYTVGQISNRARRCAIAVSDNYALFSGTSDTMQVIDIRDPYRPTVLGELRSSTRISSISISDGLAYVSSSTGGLQILNYLGQSSPVLVGNIETAIHTFDMYLYANKLYLALGPAGMQVMDISDPDNPQSLGLYDNISTVYGVVADDDAYLLTPVEKTVHIVNLRAPYDFTNLATIYQVGVSKSAAIANGYLYVSNGISDTTTETLVGELVTFDVSRPDQPLRKATLKLGGYASEMQFKDGLLYASIYGEGLMIIDANDPDSLISLGKLETPGDATGVSLADGHLYITDGYYGLQIVDITNPDAPALLSSLDTPGYASTLAVNDQYAYIADGLNGIQIIDVKNPTDPQYVGSAETRGYATEIATYNGYLYAGTSRGIEILKAMPARKP